MKSFNAFKSGSPIAEEGASSIHRTGDFKHFGNLEGDCVGAQVEHPRRLDVLPSGRLGGGFA